MCDIMMKVVFFVLVGLSVWNFSKLPFFMAYSPIADNDFNRAGVTVSVNLVQWVHTDGGYHGDKLKSPAANFFLVHMMFGITVLVMIALPILNHTWRKKYGHITFTFAILLGLHTLPAALEHKMRIIFVPICLVVIVAAMFGFGTLLNYHRNRHSECHLKVEYLIIAVCACGAGLTEFGLGIIPNMLKHAKDGVWPPSDYEGPHPLAGKTAYDIVPDTVGYVVFFTLVAAVWVIWPLHLLTVDTTAPVAITGAAEQPGETQVHPDERAQLLRQQT